MRQTKYPRWLVLHVLLLWDEHAKPMAFAVERGQRWWHHVARPGHDEPAGTSGHICCSRRVPSNNLNLRDLRRAEHLGMLKPLAHRPPPKHQPRRTSAVALQRFVKGSRSAGEKRVGVAAAAPAAP